MLVDCHCHLLHDLDDGAQTLDEALALARQEVASGVTHAVVTPHGSSQNLKEILALRDQRLQQLQETLEQAHIPLTLVPGLEYYCDSHACDMAVSEPGCRCGLPEAPQRPILVELNTVQDISYAANLLFNAQIKRIPLILAHPERYRNFTSYADDLAHLAGNGLYLQFNAVDFKWSFLNWNTRRTILRLIRDVPEQILLGSDAHHPQFRPAGLELARSIIVKTFGEDIWQIIGEQTPKRLYFP